MDTYEINLQRSVEILKSELEKREDWYETWRDMLAECIERRQIPFGEDDPTSIAEDFLDNYLIGEE